MDRGSMTDKNDKKIGRPPAEDPKVIMSNVRIRESVFDKMASIAVKNGISQSEIWEEAALAYLHKYEELKSLVVRL